MTLSIVIVNYNVKYFLEQCLLSIVKASIGIDAEIIVVDNQSTDGSVDYIRERFPSVRLIANDSNPGFSKANNQGINFANGKYILILNPDTVVAEDTFKTCIDFMESNPTAGAVGVQMIDGAGQFLPESKRGLPTPAVAFYKMFGLASLLPQSRLFGAYHLSYLSKDEIHEVEILSGAFMFFRKAVLDTIGLFDETFFMYGEDIDLSYRVLLAGYKNYYLADTTIIHYKGESTKKGSLNYVKVFYQAMIIFAHKHFASTKAGVFSFLINLAVIFRAIVTLLIHLLSSSYLFIIDGVASFAVLYYLVYFWASNIKNVPSYYPLVFIGGVVPLYLFIWIATTYFTGGYEKPYRLSPIFKGVAVGTIIIAALYGLLPEGWRFSRAIIILGGTTVAVVMLLTRLVHNLLRHRQFAFEREENNRVLAIGTASSISAVKSILQQIAPQSELVATLLVSDIASMAKLADLYQVNEIVLATDNLKYAEIIAQIKALGHRYQYKIYNQNTNTLIGSNSKNTAGDLYSIDSTFNLSKSITRRQKRILDLAMCLLSLLMLPIIYQRAQYFKNMGQVLLGRKTWVGYIPTSTEELKSLPRLPSAILYHTVKQLPEIDAINTRQLNYLYARHYSLSDDWKVIWKNLKNLGQ